MLSSKTKQSILNSRRYDRLHTPLVAVLVYVAGYYRDLLIAVNCVTLDSVAMQVRYHYPKARVEAWREVGTLAKGIDAELCEAFGLGDAEKLY